LQTKQESSKSPDYNEKIKQIGEILGILEETRRGKNWILQEIKKRDLKVPFKQTMNAYEILHCLSPSSVSQLLYSLKGDDIKILEGTQIKTQTYHWFFTDIVAGSNPSIPTKAQVRKITILNELISKTDAFRNRDPNSTIILPTGDGMAIGFRDSPENPLRLAIELHKALFGYNQTKRGKEKLLIRVGLESGPVYFVRDLEGKENVWGPGILLTRRVMDLGGNMQIFAATRIAEYLAKISPQYKDMLHPVQKYETKYGEELQLYNVYGEGFGSNAAPRKAKVPTANLQRSSRASINFSFSEIQILLDVIDLKTMQTHHTWLWDVVNISKEPKSKIFYYLDGQVPKEFADLNVTVSDENNNRFKIGDITVDKPYHKEFHVLLDPPVLQKQRIRLKLQYDWEEPDRTFLYKFPSGAKKFVFICTVPKEIDVKNRILKVDIGTGYRVHATPPTTIKRHDDKTVISWEKRNIPTHDAYQFDW